MASDLVNRTKEWWEAEHALSATTKEDTITGLLIVLGWRQRPCSPSKKNILYWYREATVEEIQHAHWGDVSSVYPDSLFANTVFEAARTECRVSGINLLGEPQDGRNETKAFCSEGSERYDRFRLLHQ